MTLRRRQFLRLAGAAAAWPFAPHIARAQAWPNKTIRVIAPFSAGSTVDVVGRLLLEPLSQQLGQTLVLENRVGAGGMTGATTVARADPDGYTLLINSSAHSAIPAIYPNVPYDAARDFAAVASLGSSPNVTVVAPDKGFKTLKELVAAAKSRPGGLTYATAGVGSATHLSTERFRVSAGFEAVHVPFKGMPEALTEVMTGRVDFTCSSIAPAIPLIRSGKVTALAVTTPKRSPALPDVPTSLRPVTPIPTTRSGSASSSRPRPRAKSSTGCIRKCRRSCRRRAWTNGSRRMVSIRCRSRRKHSMRWSKRKSRRTSPW